jgi:hypothetical protein
MQQLRVIFTEASVTLIKDGKYAAASSEHSIMANKQTTVTFVIQEAVFLEDSRTLFVVKKMAVLWDIAPCSLAEVYRRFRGAAEDSHLHTRRRENLKSHSSLFYAARLGSRIIHDVRPLKVTILINCKFQVRVE